jgi:hypothetical protein
VSGSVTYWSLESPSHMMFRYLCTIRTPENPHRGLIPKTPKFGGHKKAYFGDLHETFVPKGGGAQCFLILNFLCTTFSGTGSSNFWDLEINIWGVWSYTFWLQRPQIWGFASYIWAPEPKFSGVIVMDMQYFHIFSFFPYFYQRLME